MECSGAEAAEAKIVRRGDGHVVTNVKGRALAPRSPLARLRLPAHGLSCAEQKGVLHTQSCIAPTHTHTYKRTHRQAHKHETHTHTRGDSNHCSLVSMSSSPQKEKKLWNFDTSSFKLFFLRGVLRSEEDISRIRHLWPDLARDFEGYIRRRRKIHLRTPRIQELLNPHLC